MGTRNVIPSRRLRAPPGNLAENDAESSCRILAATSPRLSQSLPGSRSLAHIAAQLGVGRLPDLAHPALAEEGGDVVVAEAGTGTQGHDLSGTRSGPFYARNGPTTPPSGTELPQKAPGRVLRGSGESGRFLLLDAELDSLRVSKSDDVWSGRRRPLPRSALGFGNLFSGHAAGNVISVLHGPVAVITGESCEAAR